jgi:hypothetical protein
MLQEIICLVTKPGHYLKTNIKPCTARAASSAGFYDELGSATYHLRMSIESIYAIAEKN